jgi:hypothetical protein
MCDKGGAFFTFFYISIEMMLGFHTIFMTLFFCLLRMQLKIYNTLTRQKEFFVPLMEDPSYK